MKIYKSQNKYVTQTQNKNCNKSRYYTIVQFDPEK